MCYKILIPKTWFTFCSKLWSNHTSLNLVGGNTTLRHYNRNGMAKAITQNNLTPCHDGQIQFQWIHQHFFNNLTFRGPCSIVIYSYNESQRDALISQIYFGNRTLHVSDRFSVHHQESSTVHTAIHTGYADCLLASSQHNLYDIHLLLCVQC